MAKSKKQNLYIPTKNRPFFSNKLLVWTFEAGVIT